MYSTLMEAKKQDSEEELALEVTVLSAHSLKNPLCCLLPGRRLRPYVTLSTSLTDHQPLIVYRSRVDEAGAHSPKWGDTITVPISPEFLRPGIQGGDEEEEEEPYRRGRAVRVRVMSKRLFGRAAEVGWCGIPAEDVLDGLAKASKRRRLSYSLRSPRHGCRGYGVIELAVRVVGRDVDGRVERLRPAAPAPEAGWRRVAIGIPVGWRRGVGTRWTR